MQNLIEITDLNITLDKKKLFEHFFLQVRQGDTLGICAPTGKGKTTLLNYIAQKYYQKIKISYAFQDNRLLQNKTVLKNIDFIIPKHKCNYYSRQQFPKKNKKTEFQLLLQKFDLVKQKNTLCRLLSGGEQQRVNLARAFAFNPDLFLLDEPFSAQDETHKNQLFSIIQHDIIEKNKTMILVSHNTEELKTLCRTILTL